MLLSLLEVVAKDYVAGLHIVSLFNIDTLMVFLTYFCSNPLYTSFVYTTTISFGLHNGAINAARLYFHPTIMAFVIKK